MAGKHSIGSTGTGKIIAGTRALSTGRRGMIALVSTAFLVAALTVGGATVGMASYTSTGMVDQAAPHVVVASSRSFPSTTARRVDFMQEAASRSYTRVSISDKEDWGGIEELNIPQTRSTDEKNSAQSLHDAIDAGNKKLTDSDGKVKDDATRTALKSAIDAGAAKADDVNTSTSDLQSLANAINNAIAGVDKSIAEKNAAMAAAAAASQRAASRSGAAVTDSQDDGFTYTLPEGQSSSDVVNFAMQFVGKVPYVWAGSTTSGWDCSGFVMYVYSHFGISLPHYSGAQEQYGRPIGSLADAQPGDVIASSTHAAIYIGNGLVVNALNPSAGTTTTPVKWAFPSGGYQIRRMIG